MNLEKVKIPIIPPPFFNIIKPDIKIFHELVQILRKFMNPTEFFYFPERLFLAHTLLLYC